MIIARLFKSNEPGQQLDSRRIETGELRIGRDADQDWRLDDPGRLISRAHLVLTVQGDAVTVTDVSANGVFLGDRGKKLYHGRATSVELGSTLCFGPYLLVVERAPAGRSATDRVASPMGQTGSPFQSSGDIGLESPRATAPDPFASELKRDPFGSTLNADQPSTAQAMAPSTNNEDVWSRPKERKAGDWDAPPPPSAGHEHLIGSARGWSELPPKPPEEVGFGFDAPFTQPMMRHVEISKSDLAIPSDWNAPTFASATESPADRPMAAPPSPAKEMVVPDLAEPSPFRDAMEASAPPPRRERELGPADPSSGPLTQAPDPIFAPPPTIEDPLPPRQPPSAPIPAPAPAAQAAAPKQAAANAALVEAFCRGAKLDPAVFGRVEPEELMMRVGVVYRLMILGMSDLIGVRTSLKNEYRMARTTVRPDHNNPFKWLPPQSVASQLLLQTDDGFITGPAAVNDAFQDLKKHLLCLLAGLRAALASTLDALSPARVEGELKGQSMVMKNRGAAAWQEYGRLYADFRKQADDNPDSAINREFRDAYERQLTELDRMTPD